MKKKVKYAKSNGQEAQKKARYQRLDKEVKSSLRNDKRQLPNKIAHAQEAEDAARQGQLTGVFKTTRKFSNVRPKKVDMVKSKGGKLLTKKRWQEHFTEVLNRPETTAEVIDDDNISE